MENDRRIYRRFFLSASLVIGLAISGIFLGLSIRSGELIKDQVLSRARAHFQGIVLTRKWNAMHGGVYVIKTPGMQSNPYLENPDLRAADGRVLTKKNPALMTREISELVGAGGPFSFHITSLRPLNPHNTPDPFEARALRSFEAGARESTATEVDDGGKTAVYRYMAPLLTDESCLGCHGKQGYKAGQVRGGISVSFDIRDVQGALRRNDLIILAQAGLTLALLLVTLWYFFRQMQLRLDRSQEQLRRMATTDQLTGVANRGTLMERFGSEFARHRRQRNSLGCMMLDVDHFKSVNDRFGHQKGDAVLRELASLVNGTLRAYDIHGRYGGEEFLLIMDGERKGLLEVAERIRILVESELGRRSGLEEPVTVSLGVTQVEPGDESIDDTIQRADRAMYLAKEQGRNRVVFLGREDVGS